MAVLRRLLLALVALASLPTFVAAEVPQLVLPEPTFNFGTVPEGAVIEHQFAIVNRGSAPLKIRKIHPACGCTAVVLDTDTLPPGEQTFVKTSFNTTGFRGYKVKTVRLYSNDPQQTSAVLTLQGTVQPDVEVDPPRIHFGNVQRGSTPSISAAALTAVDSPIVVKSVRTRASEVGLQVEDVTAGDKKGKKFVVTLKDNLPLGIYRSRVVVETTSERNPVVNVPIFAFVEGDWQLEPSNVSIGLVNGPLEKPVDREVVLTYRGSGTPAVVSARSDNPSVIADVSELEEAGKYAIRVRIKEKAEGVVRARVTIITEHPDPEQRELTLPVYAIISRAS
ncbi:MAG: DUF1573 domain-containing protein [Bdellovibrionales bacterium]|nr:DUF1573 domain-containing protein [Bdellovibrionales bacterium]